MDFGTQSALASGVLALDCSDTKLFASPKVQECHDVMWVYWDLGGLVLEWW